MYFLQVTFKWGLPERIPKTMASIGFNTTIFRVAVQIRTADLEVITWSTIYGDKTSEL